MPRRSKYTKEILQNAVQNSYSIGGTLRYLGSATISGGAWNSTKKLIKKFGIDTSHFRLGKVPGPRKPKNRDKQNEYQRIWYSRNKEKRKKEVLERKKNNREWLTKYKEERGCSLCDEHFYLCLHFHHCDPKLKEIEVSKTISKGWSRERTLKEVEKCIILCSNCHAKRQAGLV